MSVRNLTVDFGAIRALDGVGFDLPTGSLTAVIGPNGSGKTTLLLVLAGLQQPTAGSVSELSSVAFLQQQNGRDPQNRVIPLITAEVLVMGLYKRLGHYRRMNAAERDLLERTAERMEVDDLMRRQFSELSSGQRQRVLVAQMLLQQADILLMDEPITALDLASQQRIMEVMKEECARGAVVVFSTHHLDEARQSRHVLMLANRLTAQGPPELVLTKENLEALYGGRVVQCSQVCEICENSVIVLDDHGHGSH